MQSACQFVNYSLKVNEVIDIISGKGLFLLLLFFIKKMENKINGGIGITIRKLSCLGIFYDSLNGNIFSRFAISRF